VRPISKFSNVSYGSNDTFGDFLVHSVQKLWSLMGLPATIVADAGVRGCFLPCQTKRLFWFGNLKCKNRPRTRCHMVWV